MPDRSASTARFAKQPRPLPAARAGERVAVLLPLPLDGSYDYLVPEGLALAPGDIVVVPLGPREVIGAVWEPAEDAAPIAASRMKRVIARCEVPPLPAVARRFIEWVAAYTMTPPGAVLRMTLSSTGALEPPRPIVALRLVEGADASGLRLTPARKRVLAVAEEGLARPASELAREAGV
ncbi:MAG: primosomal protein N', partial [Kiloniellales bacterium]